VNSEKKYQVNAGNFLARWGTVSFREGLRSVENYNINYDKKMQLYSPDMEPETYGDKPMSWGKKGHSMKMETRISAIRVFNMPFEKVTSIKNIDNTELWWLSKHMSQIATNNNKHTPQKPDTNVRVGLGTIHLMSSYKTRKINPSKQYVKLSHYRPKQVHRVPGS
jgi:hypothetical protein